MLLWWINAKPLFDNARSIYSSIEDRESERCDAEARSKNDLKCESIDGGPSGVG